MTYSAVDILARFSANIGTPAALLQCTRGRWRFAGHMGELPNVDAETLVAHGGATDTATQRFWTGVVLDGLSDWVLLLPGSKDDWEARDDLLPLLERFGKDARAMIRLERTAARTRAERIACLLARRLARCADATRTYRAITRAAAAAAKSDLAALALWVPEEGALRIVSTHGYPQVIVDHLRLEPGEGVIGRVFATRAPFLAGAGPQPERLPPRLRYRTGSCIVIPLLSNDRSIGVLTVADPSHGEHFAQEDIGAVNRIAPVAALAVARLMTVADMEALAIAARVDPVTRLANRQYLIGRLEAELERASRLQQPLAMMLVDVDDFKRVNDTFGHLEGDRLLREVGSLLADNVRLFDVCTRYGGEEFAVLMPGAHESVARQVSERVRQAVEQAFRGWSGGPKITLSVGVALYHVGDTASALIGRADAALLLAKAHGKNVVKFAG